MGDYGAAVSQKGYDVKTCADRFLVYSSAFQTLKIFNTYSVSTTIPASGDNTITINHNLGYLAPFIVLYNGSSSIGTSNTYFFCDSYFSSFTQDYWNNCRQYTDKLEIDVSSFFDDGTTGATVYFTVYIFLDDFRTVAEQNINTSTTSGASSNDYGIRISKSGYDVKTCADIDCVLSSSFFNQIINKKGILTSTADDLYSISHNLSYFPSVLVYYRSSGNSYMNYDTSIIQNNSIQRFLYNGDKLYYIIFKQKNG